MHKRTLYNISGIKLIKRISSFNILKHFLTWKPHWCWVHSLSKETENFLLQSEPVCQYRGDINPHQRATVLKHRLIKLLLLYFTCQYLASPWPCTHKAINTLLLKVGVLKQNKYCQPENGAFYNAKLRNVPSFFHNHSFSITFLEERKLLLLMTSYMQGSDTVSLKRRLRVRLLATF